MSVAEKKIAVPAVESSVTAQIQGRLDAIEARRLYGWVRDQARPQERLLVRVLMGGRMIASATADRPRIDLRRNGIGDGAYAFEVELPGALSEEERERLSVVAVSPTTGQEIVLQPPSHTERTAEAAVNAPLSRVLDQLEVLIAAQRRSQIIQRETAEALRSTAAQVEQMASNEDGVGAALDLVRNSRDDLAQRVADLEVFLLRFDTVLTGFDSRIADLSKAADRPMRRAVSLLLMLGGITATATTAILLVLLRGGF
ncbi:hypothetical protein [Microvirga brassicacearum]|uniref:Uncharacterized protein n=1 Tax=Microvirga brassicacearum TaxID=2580413 RepID=A0A5N3PA78_9HYPH|nr:hypothetical protein [Microvirga brassicacearum]KAB0266613.1 hypothetical protein FEZ63_13325 [Microvirga brassicacearum]